MTTHNKKILFAILFSSVVLSLGTGIAAAADDNNYAAGSDTQTIKVLIYNGTNVASDSVDGIKSVLDSANTQNLVPGYYFTYTTSPTIDVTTLTSYNVLAMPGGNDYIMNYDGKTIDSIDPSAIKNFVNNGGGYLGICAGAFAGANYTVNCYHGWGIAPNVNCLQAYAEVPTTIQITSSGKGILSHDGSVPTTYWNGPAMSVSGTAFVMATYDGVKNSNGQLVISNGMAAIVGDYYGKGRSALVGPHPELDPKSPGLMANLVKWVANLPMITDLISSSSSPPEIGTGTLPFYSTPVENPLTTTVNALILTEDTKDTSYADLKNNTIPVEKTGLPIGYIFLGIFSIACGFILNRKK